MRGGDICTIRPCHKAFDYLSHLILPLPTPLLFSYPPKLLTASILRSPQLMPTYVSHRPSIHPHLPSSPPHFPDLPASSHSTSRDRPQKQIRMLYTVAIDDVCGQPLSEDRIGHEKRFKDADSWWISSVLVHSRRRCST